MKSEYRPISSDLLRWPNITNLFIPSSEDKSPNYDGQGNILLYEGNELICRRHNGLHESGLQAKRPPHKHNDVN